MAKQMAINFSAPRERTINFDGGSVTVRPLTMQEMVEAAAPIAAEAGRLFDGAVRPDLASMLEDEALIRSLMWSIAMRSPAVIAGLIARAADATDQLETVAALPLDVTFACLEAIVELSISDRSQFALIVQAVGNAASRNSAAISGPRH